MGLIKHKRYSEADVYRGLIHHTVIEYQIPRIPWLDALAASIITYAVEKEIYRGGGVLLETAIYSEKTWYGIIPTNTITTDLKWVLAGEAALSKREAELSVTAIIIAIVAAIGFLVGAYFIKRYYDTIEQYGYPPWYSTVTGGIALLGIVAVGGFLVYTFAPEIKKLFKAEEI